MRLRECQHVLEGHSDWVNVVGITPDGRIAVSGSRDKTLRVWDLEAGECLAIYSRNDPISSVSLARNKGEVVIGTKSGQVIFARIRNLTLETSVVTASYVWLFGLRSKEGSWSDLPACNCYYCGRRLTPEAGLLDAIARISQKHNLSLDQTPCTELPPEAFADPQFLSHCPHCQKPLKFNPFIVDNRDR